MKRPTQLNRHCVQKIFFFSFMKHTAVVIGFVRTFTLVQKPGKNINFLLRSSYFCKHKCWCFDYSQTMCYTLYWIRLKFVQILGNSHKLNYIITIIWFASFSMSSTRALIKSSLRSKIQKNYNIWRTNVFSSLHNSSSNECIHFNYFVRDYDGAFVQTREDSEWENVEKKNGMIVERTKNVLYSQAITTVKAYLNFWRILHED